MKEEVPPPLIDAHVRMVEEAVRAGIPVDTKYGLDKTGIAGTIPGSMEETCEESTTDGRCFIFTFISYYRYFVCSVIVFFFLDFSFLWLFSAQSIFWKY